MMMIIVNRKEFLELPTYTFYRKYTERFAFEAICVKGDSLENDWYYYSLGEIDSYDSGDYGNKLDDMMEGRLKSCPVSRALSRDGCFQNNACFMIFEQDDLMNLKLLIEQAEAAINVIKGKELTDEQKNTIDDAVDECFGGDDG